MLCWIPPTYIIISSLNKFIVISYATGNVPNYIFYKTRAWNSVSVYPPLHVTRILRNDTWLRSCVHVCVAVVTDLGISKSDILQQTARRRQSRVYELWISSGVFYCRHFREPNYQRYQLTISVAKMTGGGA